MTLDDLSTLGIEPALDILPVNMTDDRARVMLIAIALQESGAQHRHQIGGPAHGYWQFEKGGGVAGVLSHRSTHVPAQALCDYLDIAPDAEACYAAIEYNDVLAAGFARMLLWTLPNPLPDTPDSGWEQYLAAWRPGKPHPHTWTGHYMTAQEYVYDTADLPIVESA